MRSKVLVQSSGVKVRHFVFWRKSGRQPSTYIFPKNLDPAMPEPKRVVYALIRLILFAIIIKTLPNEYTAPTSSVYQIIN
jgi:hypothetical protein